MRVRKNVVILCLLPELSALLMQKKMNAAGFYKGTECPGGFTLRYLLCNQAIYRKRLRSQPLHARMQLVCE